MAKDPAFLFYPSDFKLGTLHLNLKEKGGYFELLILQFSRGRFSLNDAKNYLREDFEEIWPRISDKFNTDGSLYWNERLDYEMLKRQKFCSHQADNVKKRWDKDTKPIPNEYQTDTKPYTKTIPLENENINENEIKNCIEYIGITAKRILTENEVSRYWDAFSLHTIEKYQTPSDRKKHFRNWLKKEIQNGTHLKPIAGNTKVGISEQRMAAARNF